MPRPKIARYRRDYRNQVTLVGIAVGQLGIAGNFVQAQQHPGCRPAPNPRGSRWLGNFNAQLTWTRDLRDNQCCFFRSSDIVASGISC